MFFVLLLNFILCATAQFDPHFTPDHSVIVHLFEWKWTDIADECERFLGPRSFGGVQISPPSENVIIPQRPWYERYQPISYKLETRSGTENQFIDMVSRCNNAGVRIYADAVINHMAAYEVDQSVGTAGTLADPKTLSYPGVPYSYLDFNPKCLINDYKNVNEVRNCQLVSLPDLNQGKSWVREKIRDYMNTLIDHGVAGFRIDAVKHMWPGDLEAILNSLHYLNESHNFPKNSKPFIYQEVIDLGAEAVKSTDYIRLGAVTEFRYSDDIGRVFRGRVLLKHLINWGEGWNYLPSTKAVVFIDNHDNQRGHGAGGANVLMYKFSRLYKMATAFMLAHPYGLPVIMSSFAFNGNNDGPPADDNENIISPVIKEDSSCDSQWICEHRWRQITNMVEFHNIVNGTNIHEWWDNGYHQISFCRGNQGFIAINNENFDLNKNLNTCLPAGIYCDVITGKKFKKGCTGKKIIVTENGFAEIKISGNESEDGVLAIHLKSKL